MNNMVTEVEPIPAPPPKAELAIPGIHEGIPAEVYHARPEMSNSLLGELDRSPAHYWYARHNPKEPTADMKLGTAIHAFLLEPASFENRYAIAPKCDKRTTAGKAMFAAFQATLNGRESFDGDDFPALKGITESVTDNVAATALLALEGTTETSILWTDPETQVPCRARPDRLIADHHIIVDLKTTRDCTRDSFERSIFQYGYARQAAFYIDGCAANGIEITDWSIIAVEKEPPYAVVVYLLQQDAVEWGRKEYKRLLALYAECAAKGKWPSSVEPVEEIGLPVWVMRRKQFELPY